MQTRIREQRLRRLAASQDMKLTKSRRRNVNAYDHGLYGLLLGNMTVLGTHPATGTPHTSTLDEVADFLAG